MHWALLYKAVGQLSSSQQPFYILPEHFLLFLISYHGLSTNFHINNVIPIFETIKQSAVTSIIFAP